MSGFIRIEGDVEGLVVTDNKAIGVGDFLTVGKGASLKDATLSGNIHVAPIELLRDELAQKLHFPQGAPLEDLRECLSALQNTPAQAQEERIEVVKKSRLWPHIEGLEKGFSIAASLASIAGPALARFLQ